MVFEGKWIQASTSTGDVCPVFRKRLVRYRLGEKSGIDHNGAGCL